MKSSALIRLNPHLVLSSQILSELEIPGTPILTTVLGEMVTLSGQMRTRRKFLMSEIPTMVASTLRMLTSSELSHTWTSTTSTTTGTITTMKCLETPLEAKRLSLSQPPRLKSYSWVLISTTTECILLAARDHTPKVNSLFKTTLELPFNLSKFPTRWVTVLPTSTL
jgi:hypothetical protein